MYRASFIIVYYDQQLHDDFTKYHTPTCTYRASTTTAST